MVEFGINLQKYSKIHPGDCDGKKKPKRKDREINRGGFSIAIRRKDRGGNPNRKPKP